MSTTTKELPAFAQSSRLLTIRQTMELIGCRSRTTLWRYIKKLGLKPYKMGKHNQSPTKFSYDEVMFWRDQFKKG